MKLALVQTQSVMYVLVDNSVCIYGTNYFKLKPTQDLLTVQQIQSTTNIIFFSSRNHFVKFNFYEYLGTWTSLYPLKTDMKWKWNGPPQTKLLISSKSKSVWVRTTRISSEVFLCQFWLTILYSFLIGKLPTEKHELSTMWAMWPVGFDYPIRCTVLHKPTIQRI